MSVRTKFVQVAVGGRHGRHSPDQANTRSRRGWWRAAESRTGSRVLVVGVIPSLIWPVVRSLSMAGICPVVLGWQPLTPLQLVADCQCVPWRGACFRDGKLAPMLIRQVVDICVAKEIDIVLPADYPSTMFLAEHGHELPVGHVCAVPDPELMGRLHDKWQFAQLVERLGLPQPRTESAQTEAELRQTTLAFPIITKPIDRWGSVGFQIHDNPEQLARRIATGKLAAEFPLLIQEYIPGHDVGFAFLARSGALLACAAFEHSSRATRRCFEDPRLCGYVSALVRETSYHGVGEIDARYDPLQDEYRLLEINPRFWASLLYVSRAGINFPELLVRLNDISAEARFELKDAPIRLSPYERTVGRGVLVTQRLHQAYLRWRERHSALQ